MDSKAEGFRQSLLEKQRQKIYDESEKERQKNAKVHHHTFILSFFCFCILIECLDE